MPDPVTVPYASLDRPEVLLRVFHPRRETPWEGTGEGRQLAIPVEAGVSVGARFYPAGRDRPTLLFFHGNGEIVADYEDLAAAFVATGFNFLPVDYRGYGRSGGLPTVTAMMADCHRILDFTRTLLAAEGYRSVVAVAGRSLGSASALELAAGDGSDGVAALVLESAFAAALPLLRTLGLEPDRLGIREEEAFRNEDKIRRFAGPTRILHGELDTLIPPWNAQALFAAAGAVDKRLVLIPGAEHNTVFAVGLGQYLETLTELGTRLTEER